MQIRPRPLATVLAGLLALAVLACSGAPAVTNTPGPATTAMASPAAPTAASTAEPSLDAAFAGQDAASGEPGPLAGLLPDTEAGDIPAGETTPVLIGHLPVGPAGAPSTTVIGPSGGTVAAQGIVLDVPASAFAADTPVTIVASPIDATALDLGAYGGAVTPVTPLFAVDTGTTEPTSPVTVTLAYPAKNVPAGSVAMAFYYDDATGRLSPLSPLGTDAAGIHALAPHFSKVLGALIKLAAVPEVADSGFRPAKDDWQFPNYGSYAAPRGHCEGQSASAIWYYTAQRRAAGASPLYGLYDNNGAGKTPVFWQDDSQGYRLASAVQAGPIADGFVFSFLDNLGRSGSDPALTAQAFRLAIAFSGEPQLLSMTDSGNGHGHAMVAYRVSASRLYVADPNYPGRLRTIRIDPASGVMGPYSSGASASSIAEGNAIAYTRFAYLPVAATSSSAGVAAEWARFEANAAGAGAFPGYEIRVLEKDASGKDVWPRLTDGYVAQADTVTLGLTKLDDGAASRMLLFPGDSTTPSTAWGWKLDVKLVPGDNPLGFLIYGRKGEVWKYVDFARLTIRFGEAPSSAPPTSQPPAQEGDPVVTAFTGPDEFVYKAGATYTYSISITGGTAPYHVKWLARGAPVAETTGTGTVSVALTADQMASSGNGGGYYISAYVLDAAGNGARWWDAANDRPSLEFMYALERLGKQQKVVHYPPIPYPPVP